MNDPITYIQERLENNPTMTFAVACEGSGISSRTARRAGLFALNADRTRTGTVPFTREEAIVAIQDAYDELDRTPKLSDFIGTGREPSHMTIYRLFGSWPNALWAAGVEPVNVGATRRDDSEIIDSIKSFVHDTGEIPSCLDFIRATEDSPCLGTIIRRFGTWTAAVEAAGYEPRWVRNY